MNVSDSKKSQRNLRLGNSTRGQIKKNPFLYGKCDSNVNAGIKNVWNFTSKPTIQIHAATIRH